MRRLNYWQALLIAVAVGAVFSFATIYAARNSGLSTSWTIFGFGLLVGLAQVIPGILAGYLAGRRGFLLGAVTGLLTFLVGLAINIGPNFGQLNSEHLVLLSNVLPPVVMSAVSGLAGEFIRSKSAV